MDAKLKNILDELPDKPPRSRLEPYREFIGELRSRGRTYRDIAKILAEKCSVQVTGSGVHDFVRSRSRPRVSQAKISPTKTNQVAADNTGTAGTGPEMPSREEVQRKIAALKTRHSTAESGTRGFEYNPDEPLRLKRSRSE
jgi:hypothetical protein